MPESGCQGITQYIVSRSDLSANKDLLGSKTESAVSSHDLSTHVGTGSEVLSKEKK